MTLILAHRGNVYGRNVLAENSIDYLREAIDLGYGIELDVRRASNNNNLIISHNPSRYDIDIDARIVLAELSDAPFTALNIKEEGLCDDLLAIKPYLDGFVFDFELCCNNPDEEIIEYQNAGYQVARRYSDRGEVPHGHYDYIWLDEMDKSGSLDLSKIDLSKTIYASPELHGRSVVEARQEDFFAICTDYCECYEPENI